MKHVIKMAVTVSWLKNWLEGLIYNLPQKGIDAMKKDWLTSHDIVSMPPIDPVLYCHKHHCKTFEFLNFIDIVAPTLHNCKWNNIKPSLPLLWKPAHFIWGLFEQGLKRNPQGLAKGINNSITWEFK